MRTFNYSAIKEQKRNWEARDFAPEAELREMKGTWAVADMLSNNFYIRTKTLISPRRITLLLISANHFSPHLASPEGEGQLLLL